MGKWADMVAQQTKPQQEPQAPQAPQQGKWSALIQQAQAQQPGFLGQLGTAASQAGRNLLEGAMGLPNLIGDVAIGAWNDITGQQIPGTSQWMQAQLNRTGVQQGTGPIAAVERAIGGAGLPIAAGQNIASLAPLATGPAAQATAATTGALSGEAARGLGYGPKTQLAASLLGGFAGGAALPSALQGGRAAVQYMRPTAEQQLTRTAQAIGEPVMPQLAALGEKATLADVSPGYTGLAQGVVARTPVTRQMAGQAMAERVKDLSGRMLTTMQDVMGKEGNLYEDVMNQMQVRSQNAGPLYKAAYAQPIAVTVKGQQKVTQALSKLLNTDAVQRAIPLARRIASNEQRPFDENNLQSAGIQAWDDIKRGMDDVIEANRDQFGRLNQVGNSTKNVKDQLLTILDNNKTYKLARNTYAGDSAVKNALEFGGSVLGSKMSPGEAKATFNAMSPSEQDAALSGLAGAIKSQIGRVKEDTMSAMNFIRTPNNKEKIVSMLGNEGYGKLRKFVETEVTYRKTMADVVGGAQTQLRQEAARSVNRAIEVPTQAPRLAEGVLRSISKVTGLSDKEATKLTRLVATPEGKDQAIKILIKAGMPKEEIQYFMPALTGTVMGATGGQ